MELRTKANAKLCTGDPFTWSTGSKVWIEENWLGNKCDIGPSQGLLAEAQPHAGNDQEKHKLAETLPAVFKACKNHYLSNPAITGADFFEFVKR